MKKMLVAAVIGMTLLCRLATAQDGSTAATIQSLEKEQQQLRAELNVLRVELQNLRRLFEDSQKNSAGDSPTGGPAAASAPTLAALDKKLDRVIADLQTIKGQSAQAKSETRRPVMDLVGKAAPAFSLATMNGVTISNSEFAKHGATVLNFVAPNCGFCGKQIPTVERIRQQYEASGVRFINVSQQMGQQVFTPQEAEAKYVSLGSKIEVAIDEGNTVGKLFSATAYPTMVVVARNGTVSQVNVGAKADLEDVLKQQLGALVNPPATTQPQQPDAGGKAGQASQKPPSAT